MKDASELFESAEHRPAFLVGAAAVVVGLCLAAWASWTCDDAFISFRYAQNLVEGNGLVFNVGERVEGYTNLLWTLWIAVGLRLGVGAETWSGVFGLVFYGVSLVLLFAFHLDLRRALPVHRVTLPVACLVGAAHPDFREFATSGLETSAFTAVVLGGYVVLARGLVTRNLRPLLTGAIFGVSSMLRPDGIVFAGVAMAAVLLGSSNRVRDTAWLALGVGIFWAGATAFRVSYYGQYFPNTYYAKSAYLPWHRQGFVYVGTYFHKYWPLLAGPIGVAFVAWSKGRSPALSAETSRWFRVHSALSAAFAVAYTYYVIRVGGDFMYARLLVPVTPYLALMLELGLYRVSLTRRLVYLEIAAAVLLLLVLIPRPVSATEWKDGIAEEPAVYDNEHVLRAARTSEVLTRFFRGLNVRVAFLGTEARVVYQAGIPVAIEADTGLTDEAIAHQPLTKRGRVGHEKRASVPYLITVRSAQLLLSPGGPEDLDLARYIPLVPIELGPVEVWALYWDPELMTELQARGAVFTDFRSYLDRYLETLATRPEPEIRADYRKFRYFYFSHVEDPGRETPFRNRLHLGAERAGDP